MIFQVLAFSLQKTAKILSVSVPCSLTKVMSSCCFTFNSLLCRQCKVASQSKCRSIFSKNYKHNHSVTLSDKLCTFVGARKSLFAIDIFRKNSLYSASQTNLCMTTSVPKGVGFLLTKQCSIGFKCWMLSTTYIIYQFQLYTKISKVRVITGNRIMELVVKKCGFYNCKL